jgi:arsenite methyltransferase
MFRTVRERVLDRAELAEGETLLDVGCGDGLIAFGAVERGAGLVIFGDISQDLLDESRRIAEELDVLDRCRFLLAPADDLHEVADESVDVVTTRSVLIYVDDKESAFREFHRVLRPGGRVSLFEPINRLNRFLDAYDVAGVRELDDRVKAVFRELMPPETDPMLNFDDRDLVDLAERAGFERVHLILDVETSSPEPAPWDAVVDMPPNPRVPSLREADGAGADARRARALRGAAAAARRGRPRQPPDGVRLSARGQVTSSSNLSAYAGAVGSSSWRKYAKTSTPAATSGAIRAASARMSSSE